MTKHKIASLVKSGIRIAGYGVGIAAFSHNGLAMGAFALLIFAEVIGIIEEEFE